MVRANVLCQEGTHESLVAFSQAVGHQTQSLESCWDQEGDNYIYNLHVFTPMCSAPWNKGYNKSSDPKSDPSMTTSVIRECI